MKRIPLNMQTFSELITQNCVYVDKTDQIHNLITSGKNYFFSRPRRFGKSLLVSTLESIFEGKRELFVDLAISKTDYIWPVHPIIKIDFSLIPRETAEELRIGLCNELHEIARFHGVTLQKLKSPGELLKLLVRELSHKNTVVILIDEYDKPILDHIDNLEMAKKCQRVLKDFYEAIKALDKYCRFLFLTGVSKFTKTSVFSGLNNLNDISEKKESAQLVGYTKAEIEHYFDEHVQHVTQCLNIPRDQLLQKMKEWYDGYRFCKTEEVERLYAPLSIMYCLKDKTFDNFWFTTGTPSYLVNLLRTKKYDLSTLEKFKPLSVGNEIFLACDLQDVGLEPLLYQAGYLTIKTFDANSGIAQIDYPNKEIRESMHYLLVSMKSGTPDFHVRPAVHRIKIGLLNRDIYEVCAGLQTLLAHIPYFNHLPDENFYHSLFHMILIVIGFDVTSEESTAIGRSDLVVDTGKEIFVIELKLNKSTQEALDQILKKRYHEKYLGQGKPLTLVGINFDYQDKKIFVQHIVQSI